MNILTHGVRKLYFSLVALPTKWTLFCLRLRNRFARRQIVAPGGPVVSLTTYGQRFNTVFLAIESIARGSELPSRFILWLDERHALENPPPSILRLRDRGLEVRATENWGPHKKYFPFVQSEGSLDTPLVTADDDVIYPRGWLRGLRAAYEARPDLIHCYRASVVGIVGDQIVPYASWHRCGTTSESFRNFATGVSGIIYPPRFLAVLRERGDGFLKCCPRADDIWLHATAVSAGFKVRQIVKGWDEFPSIPRTQDIALANTNLYQAGNDAQIRQTYRRADIERLARS